MYVRLVHKCSKIHLFNQPYLILPPHRHVFIATSVVLLLLKNQYFIDVADMHVHCIWDVGMSHKSARTA